MLSFALKSERFYHEETGATAIEYALIAALIAMVIIAGMSVLGGSVSTMFSNIASNF